MRRERLTVPVTAAIVGVASVVVALALPMYTCRAGNRFENIHGPGGGPTCLMSDVGYRPHSWLPTKVAVAVGGLVTAAAILLWRRRRLVALGILVAFAAMTAAWFIPDGFEQTYRSGRPICCGHVIDRGWLRTLVGIAGSAGALLLVVSGVVRGRANGPPSSAIHT